MSISVVIPAWNAATTIGEALESVLRQRPAPGRGDPRRRRLDRRHRRRRPARPRRRARPRASRDRAPRRRSTAGSQAARSSLLAFLDADDRWSAEKLALQLGWLERSPERRRGPRQAGDASCARSLDAEAASRYRLPERPQVAWLTGALLVRRDAFERVGPFAEELVVGFAIDWFDRARIAKLRLAIPEETVLLAEDPARQPLPSQPAEGSRLPGDGEAGVASAGVSPATARGPQPRSRACRCRWRSDATRRRRCCTRPCRSRRSRARPGAAGSPTTRSSDVSWEELRLLGAVAGRARAAGRRAGPASRASTGSGASSGRAPSSSWPRRFPSCASSASGACPSACSRAPR